MLRRPSVLAAVTLLAAVFRVSGDEILSETRSDHEWLVPTGFRGVDFGTPKAEAEQILGRLKCRNVKAVTKAGDPVRDTNPAVPAPPHVVCSTTDKTKAFKIGGKVIATEYLFDRDLFAAVRFPRAEVIDSRIATFADVESLFEREYGEPSVKRVTRRKGVRNEMVAAADRNYQSTQQVVPAIYDYIETCSHWTNAPVTISVCSHDRMFAKGRIESAEWWIRKEEWTVSLRDDGR